MARIAGRNSWIAIPVGVICGAVVAALVWFSLPMVPVSAAWIGATAHRALTEPLFPTAEPRASVAVDEILDCHDLYPEGVWAELLWRGDGLLSQTAAPPATSAATVAEALAPVPRLTCGWIFPDGTSIVSTLSNVGADAAAIAEAGFEGEGFACESDAGALHCTVSRDGTVEDQTLRGDLWLSSVVVGWQPDDYATRLAVFVLG